MRTEQTDGAAPADNDAHTRALMSVLLADAVKDVEVVRRELSLSDVMVERLQRALDRLDCAQTILDAEGRSRFGSSGNEVCEQVSEAVRALAQNWPQDYPEGAVEWRLFGTTQGHRRPGESLLFPFIGAAKEDGRSN